LWLGRLEDNRKMIVKKLCESHPWTLKTEHGGRRNDSPTTLDNVVCQPRDIQPNDTQQNAVTLIITVLLNVKFYLLLPSGILYLLLSQKYCYKECQNFKVFECHSTEYRGACLST
jgi:hypothetical protein